MPLREDLEILVLQGGEDVNKVFSGKMDAIDNAIIRNLPDMLAGGSGKPMTCQALRSWVNDEFLYFRMDGLEVSLCEEDGSPLRPAPEIAAFMDLPSKDGCAYIGLISFHGRGIGHDTGDRA